MKRLFLALLLILGGAISAQAQSTTVSGTVTDAGAQAWANGAYSFTFVPNPQFPVGPYTWTGGTLNNVISGTLDGSGHYSQSIPSNSAITPAGSKWILQVTPNATWPSTSTAVTTVTGGTQTLNVTPFAIAINLTSSPVGSFTKAYADGEIVTAPIGGQYWNVTASTLRACTVTSGQTCTTWVVIGPGGGGGGVCPAGAAGDIQFTDGVNCVGNPNFSWRNSDQSLLITSTTGRFQFFTGTGSTSGLVILDGNISMFSDVAGGVSNVESDSDNTVDSVNGNVVETASHGKILSTSGSASAVTPGSITQRVVTTTPDGILSTDRGNRIAYNNAGATAATIPTAGSSGFAGGFNAHLSNQNTGTATLTPSGSTINGNANLPILEGQWCLLNPSAAGTDYAADCTESPITAGAGIALARGVHSLTISTTGGGTVTNVSGTANQIDVATGTTTPVISLDAALVLPGTLSSSHVATWSGNGAASASTINVTGTNFAGTGTTSTPLYYFNQAVTQPTTWNTSGTSFGMNLAAGTGRAIDIHTNGGASIFSVDSAGGSSMASVLTTGTVLAGATSALGLSGRTLMRSAADGRASINNNANQTNALQRLTFGTEAANNPAFFFDGSTATVWAADGTGTQAAGILGSAQWVTPTACLQSVSPAACGANVTGRIALAAAATTLVVNTSKVTAASEIFLQRDDSLGTALSVTCNTQSTLVLGTPRVTARTAGTSFTITVDAAPTTNPLCMTYLVFN
jgi:hypothetical protein